jgi:hypothetical protein
MNRREGVAVRDSLTSELERGGQFHAPPPFTLGKELTVPTGQDAGCATEPFWKYRPFLARIESRFRSPVDIWNDLAPLLDCPSGMLILQRNLN